MVQSSEEGDEVRNSMRDVGSRVWDWLGSRSVSSVGIRG